MPLSINSNTVALQAASNLQLTAASFQHAVQRLSSGLRINSAADDGAGLGVSQKLIAQINGFDQAQRNTQDAVSLLQTAQSGLNETMADLQRLDQLAVQASNGTLTTSDKQNIQLEAQGLIQDIDRVAQQTQFNSKTLLNGALGASVTGGGGDITNLRVQAGVTPAGTYSITAATQGTASKIVGNSQAANPSTFTGGGSITITGPTGVSVTFVSFAGESVSNFIQQVNQTANLNVTLSVTGGNYQLTSNNYGILNANNSTGASTITATGTSTDFGTSAGTANMGLVGGTTTAGTNGTVTVKDASNTTVTNTLQGSNADSFQAGVGVTAGTGDAAGISFTVTDPGTIAAAPTDSFKVTQNSALSFQTGANSGQTVSLEVDAQTSQSLGINAIDLTSSTGPASALTAIQNAINQISAAQTNLGALQNTLTSLQTLDGSQELNVQNANSNLIDANIPQETVNFTRAQILQQAGTAVLGQANQTAAGLLGLFSPNGPVL